jgi:hypothetical protein
MTAPHCNGLSHGPTSHDAHRPISASARVAEHLLPAVPDDMARLSTWTKAAMAALVAARAVVTSDAEADGGFAVMVTSYGPRPILVEVSAGVVAPCDGSGDVRLYRGPLLPNTAALMRSPLPVICFRQTFGGFPSVDWSQSTFYETPRICSGQGRARRCRLDSNASIQIVVRSDAP